MMRTRDAHSHLRSSRSHRAVLALLASLIALPSSAAELEEPCTGDHDWIQLTSSEWLRGDLHRMRNRYIDFWSREMKSQRLKWSKVAVLCTHGDSRFVTEGHSVFTGTAVVRDGTVVVETADGKVQFPRSELQAILPGKTRERDRWGLKASLGIDANTGNTNQVAINFGAAIRREDRWTRGEIEYYATQGFVDGRENINRHRMSGNVDWFFTRFLYWTIVNLPAFHDSFQNILIRFSPSTGLGWQVFDGSEFEWALEGGLGYQYTQFISVRPQQANPASDLAVRLATNMKWDIVNDLEFKLTHDTTIVPTEIGLTSHYTRAALKYEITWLLKLETAFVHNRTWDPVRRADGTQPSSDDMQLIVGFNLETY